MSFEAVIFDRDGVLTNADFQKAAQFFERLLPIDLQELFQRWQTWGGKQGFPRNLAEEIAFFTSFWNSLCDEFSLESAVREELLAVDYAGFLFAYPDAREALQLARNRGLKIGVLSNFSLASLEHSLEVVGLGEGLVDVAMAATVIGVSKPESGAYLAIAEALGVSPECCLFFDDELPCVVGADQVGMSAYYVNRKLDDHAIKEGVVSNLTALGTILDFAHTNTVAET